MASASPAIFDCDGHIIESIPEMAEFMDPVIKPLATNPSRNRMGVFPGLDGMHYPRDNEALADVEQETREYVVASDFLEDLHPPFLGRSSLGILSVLSVVRNRLWR